MSSSLCVTILKKGNLLANMYMEDMGFTLDSITLAAEIITNYNKRLIKENIPDEQKAVCMLLLSDKNGNDGEKSISFDIKTSEYLKNKYNIKPFADNDFHVLSVNEEEMEDNENIANEYLYIDIGLNKLSISSFEALSKEEYEEDYGYDKDNFKIEELPEFNYNMEKMSFIDLEDVTEIINNCPDFVYDPISQYVLKIKQP